MKYSEKKQKMRYLELFFSLLLITALFGFSACGPISPSGSSKDSVSAENEADIYRTASLEDFKTAASVYGTVTDMTEQLTYESAAVRDNDQYNMIYIKAVSSKQAERILFSDSDSGADQTDIKKLRSGVNYCYYEEEAPADPQSGTAAFYGRYLRVDNVLILVTGTPDDKDGVQDVSGKLFQSLGYHPQ